MNDVGQGVVIPCCFIAIELIEKVRVIFTYGHTYSNSMDQLGMVANSARGQPNREN